QAEGSMRDWSVTGVQTCALPIWLVAQLEPHDDRPVGQPGGVDQLGGRPEHVGRVHVARLDLQPPGTPLAHRVADGLEVLAPLGRSEERRVGKWWAGREQWCAVEE